MKKILLLATLLPLAVFAQKDVTKENYDPFFTKEEAPHIENVLPAPPTLTDVFSMTGLNISGENPSETQNEGNWQWKMRASMRATS